MSTMLVFIVCFAVSIVSVYLMNLGIYLVRQPEPNEAWIPVPSFISRCKNEKYAIIPFILAIFLFTGTLCFAGTYKNEIDSVKAQNNANVATVLVENGVAPENVSSILESINEIYD